MVVVFVIFTHAFRRLCQDVMLSVSLQIFDFDLSTEDMDAIKELDKNVRLVAVFIDKDG